MKIYRPLAVASTVVFITAGASGPKEYEEELRHEAQQQGLTDSGIPAEATDVQQLGDDTGLGDTATDDIAPEIDAQTETVAPFEPVFRAAPAAAPAVEKPRTLELAVSNDYVQGRYFTRGGLLGVDQADGDIGVYYNDDRDLIAWLGLSTSPNVALFDQLSFSVGARGYLGLLAAPNNDDVFGVAPGIEARYPLPLPIPYPVTAAGSLFFAPDVLTLGDAENILDLDLRGEVNITSWLVGLVGYRLFRFNGDDGGDDVNAANEIQFGVRFNF